MTSPRLPAALVPASQSRFPHQPRALLGFHTAAGVSHEEFARSLTEWVRACTLGDGDSRARLRVGVRIAGTEEQLQESIGAYFDEVIKPLDGFATIDIEHGHPTVAELDSLVDRLSGIAAELSEVVDPRRSFAMAGLVNLVVPGDGPFAMMLMCSHHPDVDLAATHAWWCAFGDVMAQANPGHTVGYHQVQCEPELSRRAATSSGLSPTAFDLGDLVYLRSVDEFVARARPQAGPRPDPGPPADQRDDFVTFRGSVGAFCTMITDEGCSQWR